MAPTTWLTNLRLAARQLARAPLFTTVSVLSLSLGIAAAVLVFGAVDTVLWQQPPHVNDPDSLVRLYHGAGEDVWSYPDFEDVRRLTPALRGAGAFNGQRAVVTPPGGAPRRTIVGQVSPDYFEVLGVPMARGRGFTPADLDGGDAAVISPGFWRRAYGDRADVLGQTLEINGRRHVIVGVAPPGLRLLEAPVEPDVWYLVPREQRTNRGWGSLQVIGRLAPGASLAELRVQLRSTAERLFAGMPEDFRKWRRAVDPIRAFPERETRLPAEVRGAIFAGLGGVVLVIVVILGLAASNVANMMLTRASERQREIATRLALGASRRQLLGQLLTESLVIAGLAGAVGLTAATWLLNLLASGRFFPVPAPVVIDLDWRALAFALGVTIVTGLGFGLAPALHASRTDVLPALKGLRPSARLSRFGMRSLIVTAQIAGSLALVITALLFLRSYHAARLAPIGFDPGGVIAVPIDLTQRQYGAEAASAFFRTAIDRMAAVPGVESITLARVAPLSGNRMLIAGLEIEHAAATPAGSATAVYNLVGPGYFSLIRTPLVAGREFTAADRAGAPKVAIVNEAFAARYWPDGVAIGRRVDQHEVVGVVRNASYHMPGEQPQPHLWTPVAQARVPEMNLIVLARTGRDSAAVGQEMVRIVRELDATLLVEQTSLETLASESTLAQQVLAAALGAAGLVAMALAMLGVYGVMAYVVSLRTREMGIRVALGARPAALSRMVVREGLGLATVGLCAGAMLAVLAGLAARAMLVGVGPLDPVSLAAGAGLIALAATTASYLPARRAARVDPLASLRAE
jgi:predicted permease